MEVQDYKCDKCKEQVIRINTEKGYKYLCTNCDAETIKTNHFKSAIHREDKTVTEVHQIIAQVCSDMAAFLIDKNKKYGNSALEPVRIFSKADALEQINVRIDDKINRLMKGGKYTGDDDEKDLLGYLILKEVGRRFHAEKERPKNPAE